MRCVSGQDLSGNAAHFQTQFGIIDGHVALGQGFDCAGMHDGDILRHDAFIDLRQVAIAELIKRQAKPGGPDAADIGFQATVAGWAMPPALARLADMRQATVVDKSKWRIEISCVGSSGSG